MGHRGHKGPGDTHSVWLQPSSTLFPEDCLYLFLEKYPPPCFNSCRLGTLHFLKWPQRSLWNEKKSPRFLPLWKMFIVLCSELGTILRTFLWVNNNGISGNLWPQYRCRDESPTGVRQESGIIKVAVIEDDKLNTKRAFLQGQARSEDSTSRSEVDYLSNFLSADKCFPPSFQSTEEPD